jgi:hypothetical protein
MFRHELVTFEFIPFWDDWIVQTISSLYKVTALLSREEPKDLADIWGFCCQKKLSIRDAITDAQSKAAGVFPADLGRVLCSVQKEDWESVRWIQAPPVETFISQLNELGESLLLIK